MPGRDPLASERETPVGRAAVYFPGLDGRGGAERLAVDLALGLSGRGWDTLVLTDRPVDRGRLASDLGVDVSALGFVTVGGPPAGGRRWREVRRLVAERRTRATVRRLGVDLFVNAKYKSSLPGCGRRNVYYCHFPHRLTVDDVHGLRSAYLRVLGLAERVLVLGGRRDFVATYDDVWANSGFTADHVRRRWRRHALVLHPCCEQVPPREKRRTIAVVGRFQAPGPAVPYKAQDVLVRAFADLTDLHAQGWRLVMVGGTTAADAEYLDRLADRARGLPVDLVVDASREQVRTALGEASLFWHAQGFGGDADGQPQTQEHFGISTVEAMAAGAIPLVYDSAGPAEVASGVPGLPRWRGVDELARLTRTLAAASPEDLDDLRRRCRERAADFDAGHFRRRLGELL